MTDRELISELLARIQEREDLRHEGFAMLESFNSHTKSITRSARTFYAKQAELTKARLRLIGQLRRLLDSDSADPDLKPETEPSNKKEHEPSSIGLKHKTARAHPRTTHGKK